MRAHYVSLLAVILAACADAGSINTYGSQVLASPLSVREQSSYAKRLLRSQKSSRVTNNNEERGIGIGWVDDFLENHRLNQLLNGWKKRNVKADDAIKNLNLKAIDNVFESSEWQLWTRYMGMISKADDLDEDMVLAMMRQYGVDKLAALLNKAKTVSKTEDIATKLEQAQTRFWLRSSANTPESIFDTLKLTEADNIFSSPQISTWVNYLKAYNERYPARSTTMLKTFSNKFGDDGVLLKMVAAADDSPTANIFASQLQDEIFQQWLEFTKSPSSVFKLLKLDQAGDDLLTSPLLVTWVKYMNAFNEKIPSKQTTMIKVFTHSYGDEKLAAMLQAATKVPETETLATNLQKAQFNQWMIDKKTPEKMKSVLKIDSTGDDNHYDIWLAFSKAYKKEFPSGGFSFDP